MTKSATIHKTSEIDYRELCIMQQGIFDVANYSIISTDLNGVIRSFNRAASALLGYTAEELIGKHTPALFHDPAEVRKRATNLSDELGITIEPGFEVFVAKARQGITEELEWSYINKNGSRIPVLLSVTALRGEAGDINGFLGISFDITEKIKIKRALQEEEERYRLLFEEADDSIFLTKDDRFIDCNPATLDMFGCTREQIINQTPYRYSPQNQPDGTPSQQLALEKLNAAFQGEAQFFEWRHLKHNGTPFDAEVTLNVIEISGQPHILANVRDITHRKKTERELEISRKKLLSQNESLWLINNLSDRLHGNQSFQTIIEETLDALLGVTETTHVAIYLLDENKESLILCANHGFDAKTLEAGKTIPLKNSLSGYALNKDEIIFSADFETDDRLDKKIRQALLAINIRSGTVVPLIHQGTIYGSINILYKIRHNFTEVEKETLYVIGNTVSQSLAYAQKINDLEFMAHHDSLTGLPNRALFHKVFKNKLKDSSYKSAALLLLDLDRFKEINDTLGHHIGDKLLQKIGPRLSQFFSNENILISRLGGDEFTVLVDNISDKQEVLKFAEKLLRCLREPIDVKSMKLEVDASIGIAMFPEDGADSHALLRSADVAMYEAKNKGGGIQIYDHVIDKHTPERLALIADLNSAIREDQLVLHYQPKVDLATNKIKGFEALVRWDHKEMGLLYPDKFIPLIEMSDSIHLLTQGVLRLALQQQQRWTEDGYSLPVAVNLSARNLIDGRCVNVLTEMLNEFNVVPGMLELEITETALMQDPETAMSLLNEISELGVNLSIDDFGTGYSSLSYLRKMPIDSLKIDREFVKDMLTNDQDAIIVSSTIALAHNLKLNVIAEGVEDHETMDRLKEMGCDLVQGYYISRPKAWPEIKVWLNQQKF
ncbi:MAG: EAL domain-containing protein [Gammaproteobacteria bacterium]|nr:EAL domain-containing protein [Gammaproteobacteria bacterium]